MDRVGPKRRGLLWWALAIGTTAVSLTAIATVVGLAALVLGSSAFFGEWEIGPGEGKDSLRLPVQVTPTSGLVDGQVAQVSSTAFEAHSIVGIAVCLQEADTRKRGVDLCDTEGGTRFATDAAGRLDVPFAVPRIITVQGRARDCAVRPGRCLLVAASASDFDRSGGQSLAFAPVPPAVDLVARKGRPEVVPLPMVGVPGGPVIAGSRLAVSAAGFRPGEPLLVAFCTAGFDASEPADHCEPVDPGAAMAALMSAGLPAEPRADAEGRVTAEVQIQSVVRPFSGGRVDCTERRGRCVLVVAAAADTRRVAVAPFAVERP